MTNPPFDISHDVASSRFVTVVDGQTCVAEYHKVGHVMHMVHTHVPHPVEGRGIAAALVQAALDHARAQGLKVQPTCSYVRVYMRRHPQTRDLLAGA